MTKGTPLVYLETSVILAFLKGEAGRVDLCKAAFTEAKSGTIDMITSAYTLAEVVKLAGKGHVPEEVDAQIDLFFQHPWLRVVLVDRRVAVTARSLVRQFNIKPADAIHVATAMLHRASHFYTFDKEDLLKNKVSVPGLIVTNPLGQLRFDT